MIRWIPGRRSDAATTVDLNSLSYEALAAVMNALNPPPGEFACAGDRQAFSDVSVQVAQRWATRNAKASFGLS